MTDTPKHKGLYSALAAAQADMGPALKDRTNPAFKSKYADLASVMAACMPALSAHGIAVLQPAFDDDTGRYVKTIFVHGESGEAVECQVPLIVSKNDMQGYGSAVTYARRYGLMGMAGIAPEDDDGNAASKAPPKDEPAPPRGPTSMQVAAESLSGAETIDQLVAIWGDMPRSVQGDKAVIAAKDKRKAQLQSPADLGGDEIPY
jgi:hypothetical protein